MNTKETIFIKKKELLSKLEEQRANYIKEVKQYKVKLTLSIIFSIAIILIIFTLKINYIILLVMLIIGLEATYISSLKKIHTGTSVDDFYKYINEIVQAIDPTISLGHKGKIDRSQYLSFNLFNENLYGITSKYCLRGENFFVSQISAKDTVIDYTNNMPNTEVKVIDGTLFKINVPNLVTTPIYIISKNASDQSYNKKLKKNYKIKTSNDEINKYFNTYSIKQHQDLKEEVSNVLLNIVNKGNRNILAKCDSQGLVIFINNKNLFNYGYTESIEKRVLKLIEEISFVKEIVLKVNL